MDLEDPWDLQEVYGKLFDFAQKYGFDEDRERYHIHLTTGTHIAQICWFLLTESRHIPSGTHSDRPSTQRLGMRLVRLTSLILDLRQYDAIQETFSTNRPREYGTLLKGGIETKNVAFNQVIDSVGTNH